MVAAVIYRLIHADVKDGLRQIEAESIDAIVTDPPYELGFMGKKWDCSGIAYDVEMWAGALRVLKPGGHLISFGGSRTYHRMACAIEDAGFEIRDQLQWLYGSGFPKSLDVSKAIDKAAGAERKVTGSRMGDVGIQGGNFANATKRGVIEQRDDPVTAAAAALQGWGTALKPAHEPCVLARKPLIGTVAANVLQHGTGALNIDACRIEINDAGGHWSKGSEAGEKRERPSTDYALSGGERHEAGRWPANVILDEEAARQLDEQSGVTASNPNPNPNPNPNYKNAVFGRGMGGVISANNQHDDFGGASRFFTVIMEDKCDSASSARSNSNQPSEAAASALSPAPTALGRTEPQEIAGPGSTCESCGSALHATDAPISWGDAERVAAGSAPVSGTRFLYTAKAARSEREEGLYYGSLREIYPQNNSLSRKETNATKDQRVRNHHPTVKPVDLMQWLVRLVTPKGGTVLDPFVGSGSTGMAAIAEGFDFVGIEREADYIEIARRRIASVAPLLAKEV